MTDYLKCSRKQMDERDYSLLVNIPATLTRARDDCLVLNKCPEPLSILLYYMYRIYRVGGNGIGHVKIYIWQREAADSCGK